MTVDLMETLQIKVGGKVTLEAIDDRNKNNVECTAIEINLLNRSISEEDVCNFIRCNSKNNKLLLNSHGILRINDETLCLVKLLPDNCFYDFFDETSIKKININVNNTCTDDNRPVNEVEQDMDLLNENITIE
jgi:hypothetical protein